MKSKDFASIFTGGLLIFAQILSCIGNANAGSNFQFSFDSWTVFMYSLCMFVGRYFGAIFGSVFLISGIVSWRRNKAN